MNNDFFIKAFENNFSSFADKNIALYGIGYYTKVILDNFNDKFNIVGIIDKEKCGEVIYGRHVMNIEDAAESADIIIIVSNLSSADLIFRRIEPYTVSNNVQVYYTNGLQPEISDKNIASDPYWNNTEGELLQQISRHDVISFDIFDTLVIRRKIIPESVFEETGKYIEKITGQKINFVQAHNEALLYCNSQDKFFDIDMIYFRLGEMFGWDENICQKIRNMEIELEVRNAVKRKYAAELLKKAKTIYGKEIILSSDMYIHTPDIKRILSECGIEQERDYDEIYISCDVKASKYRGSMYEHIKSAYPGKSVLHIGDNMESDCLKAKEKGIDAFHLRSPYQLFESTGFEKTANCADTPGKYEQKGLFIKKAFDDPFRFCNNKGRLYIRNMYDYGYCFIGPILAYYVSWIIDVSRNNHLNKLLFAARDGYLIKRAYDENVRKYNISDAPESVYFQTSRRAASVPCIESDYEIKFIIEKLCKTTDLRFDDFMNSAFGVKCDLCDPYGKKYLYEMSENELTDIVTECYGERIFSNARLESECYKRYAEKILSGGETGIGFVNLVGQGLTQHYVEKIINLKMHGLYMAAEPAMNEIYGSTDNISAAFGFDASPYTSHYNAVKKYLFLETVMTAPYGCLIRFDQNGCPVFADDVPEYIDEILQCHDGVMDYIKSLSCKPDKIFSDSLFGVFASDKVIIADNVKKCFTISDLYGGNKKRKLF